jgi:hypothetical protein
MKGFREALIFDELHMLVFNRFYNKVLYILCQVAFIWRRIQASVSFATNATKTERVSD